MSSFVLFSILRNLFYLIHSKTHRALILLLLASKPDPLSLGSGLGLPVNYSPYS